MFSKNNFHPSVHFQHPLLAEPRIAGRAVSLIRLDSTLLTFNMSEVQSNITYTTGIVVLNIGIGASLIIIIIIFIIIIVVVIQGNVLHDVQISLWQYTDINPSFTDTLQVSIKQQHYSSSSPSSSLKDKNTSAGSVFSF